MPVLQQPRVVNVVKDNESVTRVFITFCEADTHTPRNPEGLLQQIQQAYGLDGRLATEAVISGKRRFCFNASNEFHARRAFTVLSALARSGILSL